ncbi:MAG: transglutaminase domain-containing protein [Ruminiclostridium sp.]
MKTKTRLLIFLLFACCFSFLGAGAKAYAEQSISAIISSRFSDSIDKGEAYTDLSDLGFTVDLSDEKAAEEYRAVLAALDKVRFKKGKISFGKYGETYLSYTPRLSSEKGLLQGIDIAYSDYYRNPDGSCDISMLNQDKETVQQEYEYALSVVKEEMTEAEKALALYDYIISLLSFPDSLGFYEDGSEIYPPDCYTAVGALRDKYAVCSAYSKLYAILLNESGIPAVTVFSSGMKHEWVMLELGGEWYHADCTWDDIRYNGGTTSFGDYNSDNLDIGAASHKYFLKSDEEITALDHYGWALSGTVNPNKLNKVPKATKSAAFDSTFFSENSGFLNLSGYGYINGRWYFADLLSGSIISADFNADTTDYIELPLSGEAIKYTTALGDYLYICTSGAVYRYCPASKECAAVLAPPENGIFTEMSAASDMLHTVAVIYENGQPASSVAKSHSIKELEAAAAVEPEITAPAAQAAVTEAKEENADTAKETNEKSDGKTEAAEDLPQKEEPEKSSPNRGTAFLAIIPAAALAAGFAIKKFTGRKDK